MATMQLSRLTLQQHTAALTVIAALLSPLVPYLTLESTVGAPSRLANGARPYKPKRKLCEQFSNWYRKMSPSTRCSSFQIVCQHSNRYKICIHPSKLQIPMKTTFLMLCLRLPADCAISLSHDALAILVSAATS